jgi:hypothetical protein
VSAILIQTLPLLVHCITLCNLHSVKILAACPCKSTYMVNGALNNYSANQEILCYHRNQRFVTVLTKNNRHHIVHQFSQAHIFHRSFSKIFPFIPSLPKQFLCKRYFKPKFRNVSGFPRAS